MSEVITNVCWTNNKAGVAGITDTVVPSVACDTETISAVQVRLGQVVLVPMSGWMKWVNKTL